MLILICITILLIISGVFLSVYSFSVKNIALLISSLSVITSAISGLIAIMVLKANKDKERPFLMLKPDLSRYNLIQISLKNYGEELAIIEKIEVDNEFKLINDKNFFEEIKGIVLAPKEHISFILIGQKEFREKNKNYTSKGTIHYKNLNGKKYKNDIFFSIENIGSTPTYNTEEKKAFYEMQKLPKKLNEIKRAIEKI